MKIDGCEKGLKIIEYYFDKKLAESNQMEDEVLADVEASGEDHCCCRMKCRWHGKCYECVTLHRAHQDHLPFCFWQMVNQRVENPNGLADHLPPKDASKHPSKE